MTAREDAVRLAREAECSETYGMDAFQFTVEELERFYTLAQNEAFKRAAEVCQDEMDEQYCDSNPWYAARTCRDAILALVKEV